MDLGIEGRTAVVTGSTGGLGLATARVLAGEGANVVLCGRRGDVAQQEARRLPSAVGLEVDLTAPDAPGRVINVALAEFGRIDILVWNSGGPPPGGVLDLTPTDVTEASRLLVDPFLSLLALTAPLMRERQWGRIVAIGSSGVQQPIPNLALSNVLRASVAGICKTLANEVAADGITVNMVIPGRIGTARVDALDAARAESEGLTQAEVVERSQANIPLGRYGRPDEFASVVAFLCGDLASYVTGTQVRVDGGMIASTH